MARRRGNDDREHVRSVDEAGRGVEGPFCVRHRRRSQRRIRRVGKQSAITTLTQQHVGLQGVAVGRALTNTDPALRRCWHPVARSADVTEDPMGIVLLGDPWVLYRSGGEVVAFVDRCPHRHCPLSLGRCVEGVLQCAYHGWRFDRAGVCLAIPALGDAAKLPPAARLTSAAASAETHGMVFIAPDEPLAPLGSVREADDISFMEGRLPTLARPGVCRAPGRQLPRRRAFSLRPCGHLRGR